MDIKRMHEEGLRQRMAAELEEARQRTRYLLSGVSEEDLGAQHDPIMSPLIWDYGHIGYYEDLWLLQSLLGRGPKSEEINDIYDASRHSRGERPDLDLLDRDGAERFLEEVRRQAIEELENLPDEELESGGELAREGFVYRMVLQHEHQHNETMLQTLQLMRSETGYRPEPSVELPEAPRPTPAPQASAAGDSGAGDDMVFVPGGRFTMGTDEAAFAFDNERPAHPRHVPGFYLDRSPVTNRAFIEFVESGGYEREELWDPEGWRWIWTENIRRPKHWYQKEPHDWWTERFGFDEPLAPGAPVMHVSWYEADAYARWAGKRLPTEAEWEKAASWDPATGEAHRYPWGEEQPRSGDNRANLDQLAFRPADVGAYPAGASPCGALGMIGDVWEWTASDFEAYPGFTAFPYDEYSKVFFNEDYKVLRGGSWATRPASIRNTFRNWDHPIRRQLFVGLRCAR
ncbi:ergothioneine biosynthesis protein EgtB [Rubrobacter aplysinae]|uniref:ergothioneine biosynthesis protein EgtB n=1 Tax=Rubrobacter aplysinae TaxID=909625 RepID=UPI00064C16AB|nr:ergothioneine biosynthesis protein EgtB [Rubrobacter aplysinae]